MTERVQVWTWPELCRLAGSPARARTLLADGAVRRALHGAYVGTEHPDDPRTRLAAAARLLPAGAVLAGRAALWALGADDLEPEGPLEVLVAAGHGVRTRAGLTVRTARLSPADLVDVGGRLVLSPARAVVDVARREPLAEAVAVGDAVLRCGLTTTDQLVEALDRCGPLRGVRHARSVVPLLEPRSQSLMESRVRVTLVLGGIAGLEAQVDFYDTCGRHLGRTDLHVRGVVGEYDGRLTHLDAGAFAHDRRRNNGLGNAGLLVRQLSADDWYGRPHADLVAMFRQALALVRPELITAVRGRDTLRPPALSPPRTLADRRSA